MKTVVIVGGGITGLSAAYYLRDHFNVVLVESSPSIGGKLRSVRFRNKSVDMGPDSFLTRNRSAIELAAETDLSDHLVSPARQGAALYSRGKLRKLPMDLALGIPTNLISVLSSKIVPPMAVLRAAPDLLWPTKLPDFKPLLDLSKTPLPFSDKDVLEPTFYKKEMSATPDLTIGKLLAPRLGGEMLERLIAPLIAGINAGDINHLSFAATTPELARAVSGQRSVISALRKYRSDNKARSKPHDGHLPLPPFMGFDASFSVLTDALESHLTRAGATIWLNTSVDEIKPVGENTPGRQWEISLEDKSSGENRVVLCDGLILATPAFVTAKLLSSSFPEIAALCDAIPFSSVATLLTAWKSEDVGEIYGTGFLVARKPKRLITGVTNLTSKWSHLASKDEVWLKISAGHYLDDRAVTMTDAELTATMLQDLSEILDLPTKPLETKLTRWENAFPQYNSGHIQRVAEIDSLTVNLKNVAIAGASYHGIGIPACISDAVAAAEKLKTNLL